MTATAADIGDRFTGGKIVGLQHASDLSSRFCDHRLVEETGLLRMLAQVLPETARDDLFLNGRSGPQGIGEVFKSSPVHGKTDHSNKRSHRLRMIRSQQ